MLRLYHVFNVAQCENLKNVPPIVAPVTAEATTATNADAEAIVPPCPNARKSNTAWPRIFTLPASITSGCRIANGLKT